MFFLFNLWQWEYLFGWLLYWKLILSLFVPCSIKQLQIYMPCNINDIFWHRYVRAIRVPNLSATMQHSTTTITYKFAKICIFAIDIDMYIQSSVSVPQPEFIVVSYIVTSGIRAKKGDLPIIQRRLIVTSSDILYKLWISCREGDQYLLYLHLQHNIPSFTQS